MQKNPNCGFMWFSGQQRGYCMCMQPADHPGPHYAVHNNQKVFPIKGEGVYENRPGGGAADGRGHPLIGQYGSKKIPETADILAPDQK